MCENTILVGINPSNVKELRRLNNIMLPVSYPDKFYKDVAQESKFARLAFVGDAAVGGISCQFNTCPRTQQKLLYILTLVCLAPYRCRGIGTLLLQHVIHEAEMDARIVAINLHVQISNADALRFYQKFGFQVKETLVDYYKREQSRDAFRLEKLLTRTV